jgi:hypothetical protein
MSIDDIFNDAATDMWAVMGVEATFTPVSGTPVACLVDIVKDVELQPDSYDAVVVERGITLEALVSEVTDIKRGDSFSVGAKNYIVRKTLENDGIFITVVVNES